MEPFSDSPSKKRSVDLDASLRAFEEKVKRFKPLESSAAKPISSYSDLSPPRSRPTTKRTGFGSKSKEEGLKPRSTDDLATTVGGQSAFNDLKSTKESRRLERAKINAESALMLTNGDEISYNRKIFNGFRLTLSPDEQHPDGIVVLFDKRNDTILASFLSKARSICQNTLFPSQELVVQNVRLLAYLVQEASLRHGNDVKSDEMALSAIVSTIRVDARSILFKYLADRLRILSSLVFIKGSQPPVGLNYVHLPGGRRVLVDLVRPSALFDCDKHPDLVSKYAKNPFLLDELIVSSSGPELVLKTQFEPKREAFCDLSSFPLIVSELIGAGQFAKVHRGKLGPFQCAIKIISTTEMPLSQQNQLFQREIPILRLCQNNSSILPLIGVERREESIIIITELCSCSLQDLIQSFKKRRSSALDHLHPRFSLQDVLLVAESLLRALIHLSEHRIAHRDIKSHNVLLNLRGGAQIGPETQEGMISECKLADFGLAKQIKPHKSSLKKSVGSRRWMAPEVQSGETPYDAKCDIWSLGLVLVEMVTLDLPFPSLTALDIKQAVLNGNAICYDPDLVMRDRPDFQPIINMIQQCLIADPSVRPSASQLIQLPMFTSRTSDMDMNV